MKINQLSWMIGGPQGSGVDSGANIFSRACAYGGLHVFGKREYHSNIKGEHSNYVVRVDSKPIRSHLDEIDFLVTFDPETLFRHVHKVVPGGVIIYDVNQEGITVDKIPTIDKQANRRIKSFLSENGVGYSVKDVIEYASRNGILTYGIPYVKLLEGLAEELGDPRIARMDVMINVMAVASSFALLQYDFAPIERAINYVFKAKEKVAKLNIEAAKYVYKYVLENFERTSYKLEPVSKSEDGRIIIQGYQASALGKIAGGCRFQSYYPITPASDESVYLEDNAVFEIIGENGELEKGSIVVVQTEDEIAAIAMAIGAGLAGVRASTATSGPGFSLMAEGLGWAGMNEVPVVVTLYQRGGPSTGLPTRHSQEDLLFAVYAGHGEFPRIVYASGDVEEVFYDVAKVFNFAERYQTPVIHLIDKGMANSIMTVKKFDLSKVKIDRGELVETFVDGVYKRFKFTETGVSPRVKLGTENVVFWNTGDEHDELGHITEDHEVRTMMVDKRMKKLELALQEIDDEDKALFYGDDDADYVVLSWGSTKGVILDAMDMLKKDGYKLKFVQVKLLHPFPSDRVSELIGDARFLIDIEHNKTAQFGSIVKREILRDIDYYILKYNGRPMSLSEVYMALKLIFENKANKIQVLNNGD
ncbi:2-oxoglutarate ferredoxin oxidoreductase subunit alpha [Candidatus Kryptonium thompsonii]|uniref:2-oxoglutarate ferredoxin oxidoreductase subunit alpha n=2 Tax=Candidatus Kryptonium thompsonii TaxID=1633631 RepID=A0A0P1LCI6_9BACT|nr:2-oxoacid:ferredoxin oxidoreductase subunit alpha [Candidatus Kryptonium thompsoni]CUS79042.1 2-oxoglutarate ferredoxin oxidoreductase subunit alpha [Candidatus Kryptonium thompsoni]CUS82035.1 2-oxoglutarate ferredoxin oxidoreductase subunit alpha [Candidatus Kryptonium thompsoni]CUS83510.1 2-oxoglutarate ferredoxin oxidoreductase subunit alpha [Candidatus Kryptonium thompsoni]CUT04035.1 2-oxoglutarate ferredoxin oxidoreductase subunit alpha [Candidatus Kryptonium thompsoni]CUT08108.1 2-oxo